MMRHFVTSKELTQWHFPSLLILGFVLRISLQKHTCPDCAIRNPVPNRDLNVLVSMYYLLMGIWFLKKSLTVLVMWKKCFEMKSKTFHKQSSFVICGTEHAIFGASHLKLADLSWRLKTAPHLQICTVLLKDVTVPEVMGKRNFQHQLSRSWH